MSLFRGLGFAPVIENFELNRIYGEDSFPNKVNIGLGAYRTDDGEPWVLPVVHKAEEMVVSNTSLNHEYLPFCGLPEFREAALKLALGEDSKVIKEKRALCVQCIGGTGALRLAAEVLKQKLRLDSVLLSGLSWDNHRGIFSATGFSKIQEYRYYNPKTRGLDIDGLLQDLENASENTVVILHTCAHNNTATDPTPQQWRQIISVCKTRKLLPLMDCTYQGLVSGDVDKDVFPIRHLVDEGLEFIISQSFSKNFGLYNERLGNLAIITNDASVLDELRSQTEIIIRRLWSNPNHHGARVVATILNNPELFKQWKSEVKAMADRIKFMRQMLYDKLVELKTPGEWQHILRQTGMFAFTGITEKQVAYLLDEYHIYMLSNGRINVASLTTKNVNYVAEAINTAAIKFPA